MKTALSAPLVLLDAGVRTVRLFAATLTCTTLTPLMAAFLLLPRRRRPHLSVVVRLMASFGA